jgi:hypothetical protein
MYCDPEYKITAKQAYRAYRAFLANCKTGFPRLSLF